MLLAAADGATDTSTWKASESTKKKAPKGVKKRVSFKEQPQVHHFSRSLMGKIPTLRGYTRTTSLPPAHLVDGSRTVLPAYCKAKGEPSGVPSQQAQHSLEHATPKISSFSSRTFTVPMVPRPRWRIPTDSCRVGSRN